MTEKLVEGHCSINNGDEALQELNPLEFSSNASLKNPLINRFQKEGICQKMYRFIFGPSIQKDDRCIFLKGGSEPQNHFSNQVRNQKYNAINFIPLVLFHQFKQFSNFFFLVIALTQFIPILKVGFMFTYVAPLAFVLFLTMMKEFYDELKRYQRDKEVNNTEYKLLTPSGFRTVCSKDLKVGDIVEIQSNQRIPADLILVYTKDQSVFIRTDQLDGETDWKLRKAVSYTQKIGHQPQNLLSSQGHFIIKPPLLDIYDFEGVYFNGDLQNNKESLSLENTLWANTVLASSTAICVVAYTGKETRMAMNSRIPGQKFGELEIEINNISKFLFFFMTILALTLALQQYNIGGTLYYLGVNFFRHFLLLCAIIPVSMRVNLDFAKLIYCYRINKDKEISGAVARNSTIPEELGRVQFLLSDKTGTLTQNEMIFKRLSFESVQFDDQDVSQIQKYVSQNILAVDHPMADIISKRKQGINRFHRQKDQIIRDAVSALAVCHNVTPVMDNGKEVFQASSPDEISLVQQAQEFGIKLFSRSQDAMTLKFFNNHFEEYTILANFPFTSDSKRMGILVRHNKSNKIYFYLKGADVIMKNKVAEFQRGFIMDECEQMAREGLRTLVITQKYLTEEDYIKWDKDYQEALSSLSNRKQKVAKVIEQLETNMEFLCITGVEDKLQEDIKASLENIRNAGVKVWMLTGDKVETAICISISTGIKQPNEQLFTIKEQTDALELRNHLHEFSKNAANQVSHQTQILVIDGQSLALAIKHSEKLFFDISTQSPSVVCCRVSPTQKAEVTTKIKQYTKKKTAGIGDGGNDVGMIQCADVGIGIVGKEGKQAALASDFSIMKFKHLNKLLLWHGRSSYKRSATLSQFVIHRGLIISIIQFLFSCVFSFIAIPIYNGFLILGYSTFFTTLPVFSLVLDQDVNERTALNYPDLYKTLQKGRELAFVTFCSWLFQSIYQGFIIFIVGLFIFNNDYINVVTITFSALILTEFLNVYSEVFIFNQLHILHIYMLASQAISVLMYFGSMFVFKTLINVAFIDGDFALRILYLTLISWLPLHIIRKIKSYYYPNDYEKIMNIYRSKRREIISAI